MKVEFLGLTKNSKRQNYRDWAIEIITETDFEQTFFNALFDSSFGKICHPKASLLCTERGISVMVTREDEPEPITNPNQP